MREIEFDELFDLNILKFDKFITFKISFLTNFSYTLLSFNFKFISHKIFIMESFHREKTNITLIT